MERRVALRATGGRWTTLVDLLVVACLVLGTLFVWRTRILVPAHQVLFGAMDLFLYYLPAYSYQAARLHEGALPFWNPYQGAGVPFLAMLQPGVFYPARLLLLVFDVPTAMHVSAVVHLLLAGVGTYALCRRLGMQGAAAAAGCIVYSTVFGFRQFYMPSFLESGTWLPIVCCAVVSVVQGSAWGSVLALGLAGAMCMLAGAYHIALYVVYAVLVLTIALACKGEGSGVIFTRMGLARLAVAGALAVGLAAPQIFPTLAWTSETVRHVSALTDAQIMPVESPAQIVNATWTPPQHDAPYARVYLSALVILLALIGWSSNGAFGAVIGGAGIVAYVLMLGPGTPFFGIYRLIPGLAMVRLPPRLIVLVAFFFAIGTALGVTSLMRVGSRFSTGVRRAIGLTLVGSLTAVLVPPVSNSSQLPWTVPAAYFRRSTHVAMALRNYADGGRVILPADSLYPRIPHRLGMIGGFQVLQDYDPLSSRRLSAYLHAVIAKPTPSEDATHPFKGHVPGVHGLARPELLDLVSVRVLALPRGAHPPTRVPPLRPLRVGGVPWPVYENPSARPRAYLVGGVRFVQDDAAALGAMLSRDFDGAREAVVVRSPGEAGSDPSLAWSGAAQGSAEIIEERPERVTVQFTADSRALLVLTDAFAPGWHVTIDGERQRLWQTNHFVRGVIVEPGRRRAVFSYDPPGFVPGVVAAALAFLFVGVAVVTRYKRQR